MSGLLVRAAYVACGLALATCSASAQIDPSGPWRTWRTEHFRIHAQAQLSEAALEAAREAERAYTLLAGELRAPRGVIDLVVADNVDLANGIANIVPSNRLTVYVAPPISSRTLTYYDGWLRMVIIHELTHIFHLDRADGVWSVLRGVFGRVPGLFPNAYQPSWVAEGLATYYESRFTAAGRVRGAFHRQLLAAAARGDDWPSDADATVVSPKWPAGIRPYAWGTEFFVQQSQLHGDSVVPRFVDGTSRQLWPIAISGPMRRAGGEGVAQGWYRLHRRALTDGAAGDSDQVVLDRGLRSEPHPRISPDGRVLAYVRNDGRRSPEVVVRSLASRAVVARHRVNGAPEIDWVEDVLYVAQPEFTSPFDIVSDLYRWQPGGAWERVTRGARLTQPFAGPGVAAAAVDLGTRARGVLVLGDTGLTELDLPSADAWGRMVISPDGAWVGAARHLDGRWDIVAWPAGAPERMRRVSDDGALDEDPAWSPDGEMLLFTSERSGFPQIYAYGLRDGRVVRLTSEATGAREPAITREGTLVYATVLADGFAVVQSQVEGTAAVDRPMPPPAPFQPAADIPVEMGTYQPWAALRPHFWMPLIHHEGKSGTFVGASTGGEDPIGRTRYLVAAAGAFTPFRGEAVVAVEHTRWKRASLDVGAAVRWDHVTEFRTEDTVVTLGERERRAGLGLNLRWRRWRSALFTRVSGELEQTDYFNDDAGGVPVISSPTFLTAALAARAEYASRPALAISRENGLVLDGVVRQRWAIADPGWSHELRGGISGFVAVPLPGFAHWVLAGRVVAGRTGGPTPDFFEIGGESGDAFEFVPGYFLGTGRRTFPLRGYPRTGGFTRAFVAIGELRIPLALLGRGLWKLPLVLDRLSLSVFGEVGGGWNEGESPSLTAYRDVGIEAVFDLGLGYDFPLRTRIGSAVALGGVPGTDRGDLRFYLAFGSSF
ncbi:MAG: hypothetical protein GTN62_06885 [Gemmatimonadales bacterium]|nr:hypothetical protein [Gemmatimonadales bacterium]NIN11224.1 hypothetical protein [Gemmatimonadales bacterium]NIN49823.1 hypothetical protein [Gemmatimonadales bacterium]NIP07287.1 hypothetical protein [Gemmatimonadales bacterium]NIR02982.1 hypothetical protein [Gemmatimonadales bacterium]